MKKPSIIAVLLGALLFADGCGALASWSVVPDESVIVTVSKNGITPVATKGRLPKKTGETYFLRTEPTPASQSVTPSTRHLAASKSPPAVSEHRNSPCSQKISNGTLEQRRDASVAQQDQPVEESGSRPKTTAKHDGKSVKTADDDLDEYANTATIADPLEPVNRVTFWVNDKIYTFLLRPISKTYEKVLPTRVRNGVYNVFDNLEFPVRFVNDSLQFKFNRAGQETEKFLINSTAGVGGFIKLSDRFPSLAGVPAAETGQTFAKWGIPHGPYIIIPVLGPRSLRDTVGLAGDYALYPVTWVSIYFSSYSWTLAFSTPDTVRNTHEKLGTYDAITRNTLDPYLAVRSAYAQSRKQAAQK